MPMKYSRRRLSCLCVVFLVQTTCRVIATQVTQEDSGGPKKDGFIEEGRIVGGIRAKEGDFPYFVDWDGCGGALIHSDIVLSAAHCNRPDRNVVFVGGYLRGTEQFGAEKRTIKARSVHPEWDFKTNAYDFLVLKLSEPVTDKDPVRMNRNSSLPEIDQDLVVMGLGAVREGEISSVYLQEVTVKPISHEACNSFFYYNGFILDDLMLCAGSEDGGIDACTGDSGGPLVIQGENDEPDTVVGVVSFGRGCARPKQPGVYARVSGINEWLDQQICDMSSVRPISCPGPAPGPRPPPPMLPLDKLPPVLSLTIEITMDDFPREVSWSFSTSAGISIAVIMEGTYTRQRAVEKETVNVVPGVSYIFLINDSQGDGLCCTHGNGSYRIYFDFEGLEVVLATNDGKYRQRNIKQITIPLSSETFPSAHPSAAPSRKPVPTAPPSLSIRPSEAISLEPTQSPSSSASPTSTQIITTVRVEILMDQYPLEVGYTIQEMFNDRNVVVNVPRGSFSRENGIEIRSFQLIAGAEYEFRITDHARDGLCCRFGDGRYRVVAEVYGQDRVIALSNARYGAFEIKTFVVPPRYTTPAPTPFPTTSGAPIQEPTSVTSHQEVLLTIVLKLDAWPEETGWALQSGNSQTGVLAKRLFGTYTGQAGRTIREQVNLTYSDSYNQDLMFVLLDAVGNGMCCEGAFQIYRGEAVGGSLLVSGDGNFGMTSVHTISAVSLRNGSETGATNTTTSAGKPHSEQSFMNSPASAARVAAIHQRYWIVAFVATALLLIPFRS